jgi:hypothetical protein
MSRLSRFRLFIDLIGSFSVADVMKELAVSKATVTRILRQHLDEIFRFNRKNDRKLRKFKHGV